MAFEVASGTWLWLIGAAFSLSGWEYFKQMSLTKKLKELEGKMAVLHSEHRRLLIDQATDQADLTRGVTGALTNLNDSIKELTHYIRYLGKIQGGQPIPPPLPQVSNSG